MNQYEHRYIHRLITSKANLNGVYLNKVNNSNFFFAKKTGIFELFNITFWHKMRYIRVIQYHFLTQNEVYSSYSISLFDTKRGIFELLNIHFRVFFLKENLLKTRRKKKLSGMQSLGHN